MEKFTKCVRAAALATGATERIHLDENSIYEPLLPNNTLIELYAQNMKHVGVDVEEQPAGELGGSSDIGNVSQVIPAIHPTLSIVSPGVDIPGHSHEFAIAAKSDLARIAMTKGIQALALCGSDLFGNIDLLNAVKAEFQQRTIKNAA